MAIYTTSPSSRRAWIEMQKSPGPHSTNFVALLAEGVDRNRRILTHYDTLTSVALLAEGVDRNIAALVPLAYHLLSPSSRRAWIEMLKCWKVPAPIARRPPRGGRG